MLEEMHDPVLSQPICQVGSEPPLLSSEKIFVHGHFCYWYNVAQYCQCHIRAERPLYKEENLSRCACVQNCSMLKSKPLARIGQQNRPLNMDLKVFLGHVFDFQVKLVNDILNGTTKWSICTRKWSTASGSDGRALDWG